MKASYSIRSSCESLSSLPFLRLDRYSVDKIESLKIKENSILSLAVKCQSNFKFSTIENLSLSSNDMGAPILSNKAMKISFSHKDLILFSGLLLAKDKGINQSIGIDMESSKNLTIKDKWPAFARRILNPNELNSCEMKFDCLKSQSFLMLIFSLKESLYKAVSPIVSSRFGFHEAEVGIDCNYFSDYWLNLTNGTDKGGNEAYRASVQPSIIVDSSLTFSPSYLPIQFLGPISMSLKYDGVNGRSISSLNGYFCLYNNYWLTYCVARYTL